MNAAVFLFEPLGSADWRLSPDVVNPNLARELGFTLEEVAADNLSKLKGRAEAGTLKGDGDNR